MPRAGAELAGIMRSSNRALRRPPPISDEAYRRCTIRRTRRTSPDPRQRRGGGRPRVGLGWSAAAGHDGPAGLPPSGPAIRAGYVHLGRPYRAVQGQGIGRSGRGAPGTALPSDSGAGGHLAGLSVRVAVVVGRPNRSASGPRPQPCTQAAPWRRRLPAGEARPRRSARRAACSNTHPANGNATDTNASCPVRSCRLVDGLPRRVGRGSPLAASGGRRHRARGCPTWPGHGRSCNQWSTG